MYLSCRQFPFTEATPDVVSQVASVLNKFTEQGVEVYLRFAHEMNWYASSQSNTYHGSASEFVTAWKTVAAAVAENPKVSMFWSPNQATFAQSLVSDGWWQGPDTVDIVGIDIYPKSHETFAESLSSCPNYAGFSWFEYNKEVVFYVASHGDTVAKSILG